MQQQDQKEKNTMNIDEENIQEIREQFVPLFKMFRKKLAEEEMPETEKNAILYNVIIELVNTAFEDNFDNADLSNEEINELKNTMLDSIIEIWKEQDSDLVINDELRIYSEQISKFGKENS